MLPGQWSWEKALPPPLGKLGSHGRLRPPRLLGTGCGAGVGEEERGAGRGGRRSAPAETGLTERPSQRLVTDLNSALPWLGFRLVSQAGKWGPGRGRGGLGPGRAGIALL